MEALRGLVQSKAQAETIISALPDALGATVENSNRLMAEDFCREAGFMLPQSSNTKSFLESILNYPGIDTDVIKQLLNTINFYEKTEVTVMEKWKCTVCGYIHEGPLPEDFASVAQKAGFEQIAELFLKTAANEKEHAELWFKALGEVGDTAENLLVLLRAKTTSGQICMTAWPGKRMRKGSTS